MSKDRRLNKARIGHTLLSLAISIGVLDTSNAGALEWEPVVARQNELNLSQPESQKPQSKDQGSLYWELVTPNQSLPSTESSPQLNMSGSTTAVETTPELMWQAVDPIEVIETDEVVSNESEIPNQVAAGSTTHSVTGGMFQVKRAGEWLPSISQRVPHAFGGMFGEFQTGLWLADCGVSGGYTCGDGTRDWITEYQDFSENDWISQLSLGDPINWLGLDLGLTISSLATRRPNATSDGTPFGAGQGINIAISRNINHDIAVKFGAIHAIQLDEAIYDQGKSAYGVISARIDLGGNPQENANDLYLTIGAANGVFRPLKAIIEDQERECNKMREKQDGHLSTYDYGLYCNMWGFDYGTPWLIGSASYIVNPKFSIYGEWWGRNLTLGFSIKPFEDINWIVTPGITNLIHNSDWDSDLPGHTERLRLQLTTSLGF